MKVYLDYAATTPVKKEVLEEMLPYFHQHFGNPSSIHSFGRESKKAIDSARDKVAKSLGAKSEEIYFTGSGSEADNWAIKGVAYALKAKGNHIITSKIEHHAVLHTCQYLEKEGFEVTYLDVDQYGLIDLEDLKNAIKDNTILITIMYANNEIGTIQPIKEIASIAKEKSIIFHTDAVQAYGNIEIDVQELGADLISISAHKIYGPKGIGALYIRKGAKLNQLIHGGGQEKKRRAGTENLPGIVGFGKAAEIAHENIKEHNQRLMQLRDQLIHKLTGKIPYTRLNGHPKKRLPGNVNLSFEFIEGEALLLSLDMLGIAGSSGSACTSGSLDPSHVLMAIGLSHEIAHGSLRLSLGDITTQEEIDYVVEKLPPVVARLREMSPLYEKVKGEAKSV
ncbi:cysteine desulfurase NifS [Clostridium formicaceticum]|uniref:Cysteine desulfurase IscS n=1 Tax=Clostridium formicaceticum TaxID=1497 RepID=A0AAC9RKZ2_9CLOT|nr:cysteine desulfurase NifS [Clostridium formicaceticum]AOY76995.1 cysteine desulfurase NifS [Clostridium formicaceticum]ARE87482.1 Cysteine desulfurase [Clostridium formicaceticum]